MKYKTLFRIWLKLLGVYFIVTSCAGLLSLFVNTIRQLESGSVMVSAQLQTGLPQLLILLLGLYFLLGGQWVANIAIPSNRPYCPECGYDIRKSSGGACAECGTPIQQPQIGPQHM